MANAKPTGLFLGAGASFEVGMPLVWDLTAELKAWLTPEKLRRLNEGWRKQGGGHPDGVIDDVVAILGRNDVHYESILGHIETQFMRQGAMRDHYHRLYGWMVEMVYWLLYARHTRNVPFIKANLPWLDGMAKLAEMNQPLWIFSLNHDVIVECVAARNGLAVNAGSAHRRQFFRAVIRQAVALVNCGLKRSRRTSSRSPECHSFSKELRALIC